MNWAYGLTTVPSRVNKEFPRTLDSLKNAGFPTPHLFVDSSEDKSYDLLGLQVTYRPLQIRTYGNWLLGLLELYIRNPNADRYAMFQDDFITYPNLRDYLESCKFDPKGYWNLYTFPSNQTLAPQGISGWYLSDQLGKGAVALVFNVEAVKCLFNSRHMIDRPQDKERGHKSIDGGIITALKSFGFKEYVHNPSLVQHIGDVSSMGNNPHKQAVSFRGDTFDARELIGKEVLDPTDAEWTAEKERIIEAIRQDEIRLEAARVPLEKAHFRRLIDQYKLRLENHYALKRA